MAACRVACNAYHPRIRSAMIPATQLRAEGSRAMTESNLWDLIYDDAPDEPPLYQTVCSYYIGQICDGAIKSGEPLPSAKSAAEHHGVGEKTARKGLKLMVQLGWAKAYSGRSLVATKPESTGTERSTTS
jgi:DNA-binding transcriptional regulator YhcF (GntR family)